MRGVVFAAAALAAAPAAADERAGQARQIEGIAEVFFAFDSARAEGPGLDAIAHYASEHPGMTIVLDGHADPRGTSPYNVALAARRADAVRSKLVSRGVDSDRIVIVTYGEEGLRRATFDKDRRVTAWATTAPLYAIIDESLVRGTAVLWSEPVTQQALVAPRATQVAIP